jgi:hypothetical protein
MINEIEKDIDLLINFRNKYHKLKTKGQRTFIFNTFMGMIPFLALGNTFNLMENYGASIFLLSSFISILFNSFFLLKGFHSMYNKNPIKKYIKYKISGLLDDGEVYKNKELLSLLEDFKKLSNYHKELIINSHKCIMKKDVSKEKLIIYMVKNNFYNNFKDPTFNCLFNYINEIEKELKINQENKYLIYFSLIKSMIVECSEDEFINNKALLIKFIKTKINDHNLQESLVEIMESMKKGYIKDEIKVEILNYRFEKLKKNNSDKEKLIVNKNFVVKNI